MRKYLLLLLFIPLFFIEIPKYNELNNLAIIDKINIKCIDNEYIVTLREVIPLKDDNGIKYDYKYYKDTGNNINDIISNIDKNTKKVIYLKYVKKINRNCSVKLEKKNK